MSTEKESFWRILKGEEGLMRLRCKLGIHKWSVWKVMGESKLYGTRDGTKFHYRKTCVCCNLIKGRNKNVYHSNYH